MSNFGKLENSSISILLLKYVVKPQKIQVKMAKIFATRVWNWSDRLDKAGDGCSIKAFQFASSLSFKFPESIFTCNISSTSSTSHSPHYRDRKQRPRSDRDLSRSHREAWASSVSSGDPTPTRSPTPIHIWNTTGLAGPTGVPDDLTCPPRSPTLSRTSAGQC